MHAAIDLIRCRHPDCPVHGGMPLAQRWSRGGFKPLVIGWYCDDRGRWAVNCPVCGERHREPEPRRVA